MKTTAEKTMKSLMQKLDQAESGMEVQLSKEEGELYRIDTMDELPLEDLIDKDHADDLKDN
ncbi:hypothetical protein P872_06070 [Rhodonellum psychrophilum GCM71 = DSM 17998]|uniref:Uncharacterized protein n=2 Tax=Rhodonellum TaxID=336827 RepID=U5C4A9_9BACT|nr:MULTISPECIES: hypothetical protein [Rhodonellum]ERM83037.1 hypothetical protein P872_06070 [Rhodonellum psychrophilum GCM71 = DSM 17998]SDZ47550.1 hypothetical protein SAMN05444412_11657 [Rhodonellum ikkaensis]